MLGTVPGRDCALTAMRWQGSVDHGMLSEGERQGPPRGQRINKSDQSNGETVMNTSTLCIETRDRKLIQTTLQLREYLSLSWTRYMTLQSTCRLIEVTGVTSSLSGMSRK